MSIQTLKKVDWMDPRMMNFIRSMHEEIKDSMDTIETLVSGIGASELGFIDGVVAGTVSANKAVVVDANKKVDYMSFDKVNILPVASAPVNAVAATKDIGSGTDGVVTITYATKGAVGNDVIVEVVEGSGNNVALSADFVDGTLTVTLGTDGTGALDGTKNTATLVATAIDNLTEFSASASGTGATPLSAAEAAANMTGGVDGTEGSAGDMVVDASYLYVCSADNTTADTNWRRVDLGSVY